MVTTFNDTNLAQSYATHKQSLNSFNVKQISTKRFFFSTDNCQGDCLSDTLDETSATSPLALASSTESTASRKYGNVFHFTSFAFAFLFLAGRATK